MLKRLAILGLLIPLATVGILAGQDAPKGTPEQGIAKPGSGKSGQHQAETKDNNNPTPKPPTAIIEASAPVDNSAKEEARENLKIQRELAIFTGLLVFVGLLQVGTMIWQARLLKQTREDVHTQANWMKTQAGYMKNQTEILGDSVAAAQASVDVAKAQIQMMKDKERARVEIRTIGLTLEHEDAEFWNLKAGIELRNVGTGRAYIREGRGNLIIAGSDTEPPNEPDYWNPLNVVDGFIDPTGDPSTESFYYFQGEGDDLSEYSQKLSDGRLQLYISGFIEYETVGTRFHRDFEYAWVGHDSPLNIGARLTFADDLKPNNERERISSGFWTPSGSLIFRLFRENREYEIEPQKKAEKPQRSSAGCCYKAAKRRALQKHWGT